MQESFATHTFATRFGTLKMQAQHPPTAHQEDHSDSWTMDIGTTEPIRCEIFATSFSPAGVIKIVTDQIRANSPHLASAGTDNIAWSQLSGSPYLRMSWGYTTTVQGHPVVGWLKVMAIKHDEVSVVCRHDEPGYEATFDRVMKSSLAGLDKAGSHPPAHTLISKYTSNQTDNLRGLRATQFYERDKGFRTVTTESFLLMRDPKGKDWDVMDVVHDSGSDLRHRVETIEIETMRNSQPQSRIQLWREPSQGDNVYHLEGSHKTEALSFKIKAPAIFRDEASFLQNLSEVADSNTPALLWTTILPDTNPKDFSQLAWEPGDVALTGTVRNLGNDEHSFTVEFDAQRRPIKLVWKDGLQLESLYDSRVPADPGNAASATLP